LYLERGGGGSDVDGLLVLAGVLLLRADLGRSRRDEDDIIVVVISEEAMIGLLVRVCVFVCIALH
jgi:hypothetical protein